MRHTYILRCADDTFYTGMTNDLDKRLREHNHSPAAAKYTRARRPVTLVRSKRKRDRSGAMKLEYHIKHLTRAQKDALIAKGY